MNTRSRSPVTLSRDCLQGLLELRVQQIAGVRLAVHDDIGPASLPDPVEQAAGLGGVGVRCRASGASRWRRR